MSLDFLKHILPDEGWYAAFILETKNHIWCRSIDSLCERILQSDSGGFSVYHACAVFREKSRKAERALSARAFWCDVDAGPGKPYATPQEAAIAAYEFCDRVGLPVPTLVGSGAGLHVYWPLVQALAPDIWRRYAKALRSLSQASGFHADPVRTADIASVLRTPGTTNRKRDPAVLVEAGPLTGPYEIESFKELENVHQPSSEGRSQGNSRGGLAALPPTARGLANTYEDHPRYLQSISDHCGQIRAFREKAGRLPEPLWHACLGVAAFCEDGKALGHAWSKGDERYDEGQTDSYLTRQGRFGPTTCERFHSQEPKICEACPHWGKIKSPIVLSKEVEAVSVAREASNPTAKGGSLDGFGYNKDGQLVALSATNMGPVETPVADFRLELVSVHRQEIGQEFNLTYAQVFPHEGARRFSLPARAVFGHGCGGEFASKGAPIHDLSEFMRYNRAMIYMLRHAGKDTVQYEQFGWKNDDTAFLYGLDLYTANGVERVSGNNELQTRCREDWVGPCKRGSLDGWKNAVNALFVAGCEPQSICLLASFAAPLMCLVTREEGGAVLHLYTFESGAGKTTGLNGAASVWGRKEGLGITNEDTQVAKALTMAALGNLPIVHDELSVRDPQAIRTSVMEFSNGRSRMRGTRTGEIKHTAAAWQTITISASNTSLTDALLSRDAVDAPAARVIELPFKIPDNLKSQYGDKLNRALRANSGWAGDAYLRWLVPNVGWAKETMEQLSEELWAETKWPRAARFWIRTIAGILVAGKIVEDLQLVDFSVERLRDWMLKNVSWESISSTVEDDWVLGALNRFIREHIVNCLVMPGPFVAGNFSSKSRPEFMPKGELVMRSEISTSKLYIAKPALRKWTIEERVNFREMLRKLQERKIITEAHHRLTLSAGTELPGGQEWCIGVDLGHSDMTGITNVLQFPQQQPQASSEEDDVPPQQPA
jgi:Domain of unknown function (DUF927)